MSIIPTSDFGTSRDFLILLDIEIFFVIVTNVLDVVLECALAVRQIRKKKKLIVNILAPRGARGCGVSPQ